MKNFDSRHKFYMMLYLTLTIILMTSCASVSNEPSAKYFSYEQFAVPDDTLVIGISLPMSKEDIIKGCEPGFRVKIPPLYDELKSLGFNDDAIQEGSVALILNSMYWNNSMSPRRADHGMRWAIVPVELIPKLTKDHPSVVVVVVNNGLGTISYIRHPNFNESNCEFREDKKSTGERILNILTYFGVGPSGSVSLHCDGLAEEGWETINYGWENEFIWVKYPLWYVPEATGDQDK